MYLDPEDGAEGTIPLGRSGGILRAMLREILKSRLSGMRVFLDFEGKNIHYTHT